MDPASEDRSLQHPKDKLLKAPKWGLKFLLTTLGLQILLWAFLVTHVPVTRRPHTAPRFSFDPNKNCICMVLGITGSGWGRPVGDTYCIDVESGQLSHIPIAKREAELNQANPDGGKRKLIGLDDGPYKLATYERESGKVLSEIALDFPGYSPKLVNDRYVVSHDENHIYLWDADSPNHPVQSLPMPFESPTTFMQFTASTGSIARRA